MSYKGNYAPSELLCPVTLIWVDFKNEIRKKMEMEPENIRLAHEEKGNELKKGNDDIIEENEIINQRLFYNNEVKKVYEFKNMNNLKKMMSGLANLLGRELFDIFLYRI
jgi:hypothetical protein